MCVSVIYTLLNTPLKYIPISLLHHYSIRTRIENICVFLLSFFYTGERKREKQKRGKEKERGRWREKDPYVVIVECEWNGVSLFYEVFVIRIAHVFNSLGVRFR